MLSAVDKPTIPTCLTASRTLRPDPRICYGAVGFALMESPSTAGLSYFREGKLRHYEQIAYACAPDTNYQ